MEASRQQHFCDMCEESFKNEKELIEHEESHEVCNLEGCTFTASPKALEEHIMLLHTSGLYARMNKGYEEHEVKKWREERKE